LIPKKKASEEAQEVVVINLMGQRAFFILPGKTCQVGADISDIPNGVQRMLISHGSSIKKDTFDHVYYIWH
jgi:hypothetical protein